MSERRPKIARKSCQTAEIIEVDSSSISDPRNNDDHVKGDTDWESLQKFTGRRKRQKPERLINSFAQVKPMQVASAKGSKTAKRVVPKSHPQEGDMVYAKYTDDHGYYWGKVTKRWRLHGHLLYTVHFDDGDKRFRVPRDQLRSVEEFLEEFGEDYFRSTANIDLETYRKNRRVKANPEDDQKMPARADPEDETSEDASEGTHGEHMRQVFVHSLIGKCIVRKWLDASFQTRRLPGMVRYCWKNLETHLIEMEVEYTPNLLEEEKKLTPGWEIPQRELISEEMALGCRKTFEKENSFPVSSVGQSKSKEWIVPDKVVDYPTLSPKRRLVLTEKKVVIELEARTSNIPGAGWGVFAKATPLSQESLVQESPCVIKSGEWIDLGIYSPLRLEDVQHEAALIVKSFVFDGKPEGWVFSQTDGSHHHCFDITDSERGDLHSLAKTNVVVYVNETDGKEPATIHSRRDPFSHVHYLLGPADGVEQISLPFDKWVEVLIDYGPSYESMRILKGYSRLPEDARKGLQDHDSKTLLDIKEWTLPEIEESFPIVSELRQHLDRMTLRAKSRFLLVGLCLFVRLREISRSSDQIQTLRDLFCDLLDSVSDDGLRETFEGLRKTFTHSDPMENDLIFSDFLRNLIGTSCTIPARSLRHSIRATLTRRIENI
eukprot:scaffold2500_cov176-Amphora_coffeaeformis.AAC.6